VAYHQAMTHAMVGQYEPAGGSVEVDGGMFGFGVARVEHPQMMGNVNALRPNDHLAQLCMDYWM